MKRLLCAALVLLLVGAAGVTALAVSPSRETAAAEAVTETGWYCYEDHPCGQPDCEQCCPDRQEQDHCHRAPGHGHHSGRHGGHRRGCR